MSSHCTATTVQIQTPESKNFTPHTTNTEEGIFDKISPITRNPVHHLPQIFQPTPIPTPPRFQSTTPISPPTTIFTPIFTPTFSQHVPLHFPSTLPTTISKGRGSSFICPNPGVSWEF